MSVKSLIINPGSTSTKIGVLRMKTFCLMRLCAIRQKKFLKYPTIVAQENFRKGIIVDVLKKEILISAR